MIKNVEIRNYKSIRHVNLALDRLNVLIGENASGKSNLLNFFQLLRDGAEGKLNRSINQMGGIDQVAHFGTDTLTWELEFADVAEEKTLFYSTQLDRRGKTSNYVIRQEEVERPPYDEKKYTSRFKFLSATNGYVRILKSATNDEDKSEQESADTELAISQIRDRARYPAVTNLRSYIADFGIFHGFGESSLEAMRGSQLFNTQKPLRLLPDGSNLVSVLQQISNDPMYRQTEARLNDVLQAVFADLDRLDTPITSGGRGALNYRSYDFDVPIPAALMSDGQLRFLGLAVLLLLPDPPSLIVIDEPEIGLHPGMLAVLAELLEEATTTTQVIIATHSAQLLNALAPEHIMTTNKVQGATQFQRLDPGALQRWLNHYSLGRLWTMGKLGV